MSFRFPTLPVLASFALLATLAPSRAEPAAADQEACTPDVFRLCSADIPSETAIVSCLNAKAAQLSPGCRAVIDPPRAVHKHRAPRARH